LRSLESYLKGNFLFSSIFGNQKFWLKRNIERLQNDDSKDNGLSLEMIFRKWYMRSRFSYNGSSEEHSPKMVHESIPLSKSIMCFLKTNTYMKNYCHSLISCFSRWSSVIINILNLGFVRIMWNMSGSGGSSWAHPNSLLIGPLHAV
jgi:hypothetical protein